MRTSEQASGERKYPFKMSRLYVNVATVVLAVFMALVTLTEPLLLLFFLILTAAISVVTFFLKIRPIFSVRKTGDQQKTPAQSVGRRELYVLLLVVIAIVLLPFLLFFSAASLPPYTWFVVLASFAAGIGISEVLFFVYCKRVM
jgi:hypothetical protein